METLYLCFMAGGAVLPIISAIGGALGGHSDIDANADVHADIHADVHTDMHIDHHIDIGGHHHIDIGHHDGDVGGHSGDIDSHLDSGLAIGLIPTSFIALSALSLVFGTVGELMTIGNKGKILTLVVALVSGYLASVIVQSTIKTLKRLQVRNYGVKENEVLAYDGTIIDTILPGAIGSVSFTTLKGVMVSFPARCVDKEAKVQAGKVVVVKELVDGICYVELKNKYE